MYFKMLMEWTYLLITIHEVVGEDGGGVDTEFKVFLMRLLSLIRMLLLMLYRSCMIELMVFSRSLLLSVMMPFLFYCCWFFCC